jgi:hypothetical protein
VLVITGVAETGSGGVNLRLTFNGDSGSNYSRVTMFGSSSGALSSQTTTTQYQISQNAFVSETGNNVYITNVFDYSVTDKHKSILSRANSPLEAGGAVQAQAGRWADTSAITSLNVTTTTNEMAAGSTYALYGIEG